MATGLGLHFLTRFSEFFQGETSAKWRRGILLAHLVGYCWACSCVQIVSVLAIRAVASGYHLLLCSCNPIKRYWVLVEQCFQSGIPQGLWLLIGASQRHAATLLIGTCSGGEFFWLVLLLGF